MNWTVLLLPTFLKELARLPKRIREQVEERNVQKLKGHQVYYKARFGDYRVGLLIDKKDREVRVCRVLHRRDIYRRFP